MPIPRHIAHAAAEFARWFMYKDRLYEKKIKSTEDNEKQAGFEGEEGGMRNKNAGRIAGEAELSPSGTARPVSETRRFKSEGEEGQNVEGRGGGKRLLSLKYVDPRATLGLFSLHPAGCSGRIPVRPERACVYRMIQKHRIIFLSLWTACAQPPLSRLLLIPLLFARSPRACDHHYAHPPSPVPWSSPFFVLLFSSSSAHNLLPSSFTSHSTSRRWDILLPRELTYPLNDSKRKRRLPAITSPAN